MREPWADIVAGDRVEVRNSAGEWHPAVACSEPRYDQENAWDRRKGTFLSISVQHPGYDHPVNWPAEDVRPAREAPDA